MERRTLLAGAGSAVLLGLASRAKAHADTLDEVKKRGILIVGTEAAYVPYEFFKDGKIIGYDPDIIDHLVGKLGVKAADWSTPRGTASSRRCMPRSSTSSSPR